MEHPTGPPDRRQVVDMDGNTLTIPMLQSLY